MQYTEYEVSDLSPATVITEQLLRSVTAENLRIIISLTEVGAEPYVNVAQYTAAFPVVFTCKMTVFEVVLSEFIELIDGTF